MEATEIFSLIGAVLFSIGGGGAIVLLLSSFLGKVWANRIMAKESAEHETKLAELRADLQKVNDSELSKIRNELDIYKQKHIKGHSDKIEIYRAVVDIVANFIAELDSINSNNLTPNDFQKKFENFNRDRLRVYGYLAMLAPQNVLDSFDELIAYVFEVIEGAKPYDFKEVRSLALIMLNNVRNDIGIDLTPVQYNGNR
jgi:hypothetical protein